MFRGILIAGVYLCLIANRTKGAGAALRLMPILTKAQVEGSKYVNASVIINRYGSLQNFTMELQLNVLLLLDDLRMNLGYYVRTRNSENWIYNKTYDFCAFLERPTIDRFGSIVLEELKHRGNVPARCPVLPGLIAFRNVTLNRIKLPGFLPETSFGLTLTPILSKMELTGSKYCNLTGTLRTTRNSSTMDWHLDIAERMTYGKMNAGYYIRSKSANNWIYNNLLS